MFESRQGSNDMRLTTVGEFLKGFQFLCKIIFVAASQLLYGKVPLVCLW
jgi:hypothetical protein